MKTYLSPFKLFRDLSVLTFAFAIALLSSVALADWSNPGEAPTGGNTPAPINVGNNIQDKLGTLGVGALGVFGDATVYGNFDYTFTNTSDSNAETAMRFRSNDGTGNWLQYWNTEGTTAPVRETAGYAFKQVYTPGTGSYIFQTSGASGAAGDAITWTDALTINGDGSVTINNISTGTTVNSNNYMAAGWFYSCPAGWLDTNVTDNDPRDGYATAEDDNTTASANTVRFCINGGDVVTDTRWMTSCTAGWVDSQLSDCDHNPGDIQTGYETNEDSCDEEGPRTSLCLQTSEAEVEWNPYQCPSNWVATGLTDPDSADGYNLDEDTGNSGGNPTEMCLKMR